MRTRVAFSMFGIWLAAACGTQGSKDDGSVPTSEVVPGQVAAVAEPADEIFNLGLIGGRGSEAGGVAVQIQTVSAEVAPAPSVDDPAAQAEADSSNPATGEPEAADVQADSVSVVESPDVPADLKPGLDEITTGSETSETTEEASGSQDSTPLTPADVLAALLAENPTLQEATAAVHSVLDAERESVLTFAKEVRLPIPPVAGVKFPSLTTSYLFLANWGPPQKEAELPETAREYSGELAITGDPKRTCAFRAEQFIPLPAERDSGGTPDDLRLSGDGAKISWTTSVLAKRDGFAVVLGCKATLLGIGVEMRFAGTAVERIELANVGHSLLGTKPYLHGATLAGQDVDQYSLIGFHLREDGLDTGIAYALTAPVASGDSHDVGLWGGVWANLEETDLSPGLTGGYWVVDPEVYGSAMVGAYIGFVAPTARQARCAASGDGSCDSGRDRFVIGFMGAGKPAEPDTQPSLLHFGLVFERWSGHDECFVPTGYMVGMAGTLSGAKEDRFLGFVESLYDSEREDLSAALELYCSVVAPSTGLDGIRQKLIAVQGSGNPVDLNELVGTLVPSLPRP
ncbi:MAG: hypothetical protein HYY13_01620 [Nitrospirae bacterium]|nr:hypothetical protein [Nitrospirota bacterium]